MLYYVGDIPCDSNYLEHYGTKGMQWGVRRWQYEDGRFNTAGKLRYFGQAVGQRIGNAVSNSVVGAKTRKLKNDISGLLSGDDALRAETKKRLKNESISRGRQLSKEGETVAKVILKTAAVDLVASYIRMDNRRFKQQYGSRYHATGTDIAMRGAQAANLIINGRKLVDLHNYHKWEKENRKKSKR